MMNRAQAVAWLRSVGCNAEARDWAMGQTIMITIGKPQVVKDIAIYAGIVYLYPFKAGGWNLLDYSQRGAEVHYDDLESAVRGAHEYVARIEAALP